MVKINCDVSYYLLPLGKHQLQDQNTIWNMGIAVVGKGLQILILYLYHMHEAKVAQSCLTLCDPMDCVVHGNLQARILEWVAVPFSRGSSQPRDWTQVSCIAGGFFTSWATGAAHHMHDTSIIDKPVKTESKGLVTWGWGRVRQRRGLGFSIIRRPRPQTCLVSSCLIGLQFSFPSTEYLGQPLTHLCFRGKVPPCWQQWVPWSCPFLRLCRKSWGRWMPTQNRVVWQKQPHPEAAVTICQVDRTCFHSLPLRGR